MEDRWTDEQEIALLKAIVRWKPVGMHKHFRMLAIRDYMLDQGVVNLEDEHTRIPGIWAKLASLYDLSTLDEREDSIIDAVDENGDEVDYYRNFSLPIDEFEGMMDVRRLNPDGSESPEISSRQESSVADTDELRSSPATGSGRGSVRGGRTSSRRGRISKLRDELAAETGRGRLKAPKTGKDVDDDDGTDEESSDGEETETESEPGNKVGTARRGRNNMPARSTRRRIKRKRGR